MIDITIKRSQCSDDRYHHKKSNQYYYDRYHHEKGINVMMIDIIIKKE